jgi:hypothetical protein
MTGVYLFCLGIGGVLLAASFFADAEGVDDLGDSGWQALFSLRNFTYFLFVFGAIGSLMSLLRGGTTGVSELILAGGTALAVSGATHYVFRYLRRTDTAEVASDQALIGQPAWVTLPVGNDAVGKIELSFGGQRVELLARPFGSDADAAPIANGSQVVIVEMVAGTALVSPASLE